MEQAVEQTDNVLIVVYAFVTCNLRGATSKIENVIGGMETSNRSELNDAALLFSNDAADNQLPCASFWIPFITTTDKTQLDFQILEVGHAGFCRLEFSSVPDIKAIKFSLVRILLTESVADGLKLISNLWSIHKRSDRNTGLLKLTELLYHAKHVLTDLPDKNAFCEKLFNLSYITALSKIHLLSDLLLQEITLKDQTSEFPRWKGKPTQFIEFISIGIELGLFEGQNQNQICNSLVKAFRVDAECEEPIYKQRFNALFKRSKLHLPLIASYISRIEESKQIKVIFKPD